MALCWLITVQNFLCECSNHRVNYLYSISIKNSLIFIYAVVLIKARTKIHPPPLNGKFNYSFINRSTFGLFSNDFSFDNFPSLIYLNKVLMAWQINDTNRLSEKLFHDPTSLSNGITKAKKRKINNRSERRPTPNCK